MGKRRWPVFVLGMACAGVAGLLPFATGMIDMSATQSPGLLDGLGELALETSLFWRAPDRENPLAGQAGAVAAGLRHYRQHCLMCHGGPGVERKPFTHGMLPRPPDLEAQQHKEPAPDGVLFQVISDGVRMTGMPGFRSAHSEKERWQIVAFVQNIGDITPAQRSLLRQATSTKSLKHPKNDQRTTKK